MQLINVSFIPALSFLKWRETQNPPGGMLADDMGLGKTVSLLALVSDHKAKREKIYPPKKFTTLGGTLVVVPKSIVTQWESEVKNKSSLTVLIFDAQRIKNVRDFAYSDVVISTYDTVKNSKLLLEVYWSRIVLDESHVIRNRNTARCQAVFLLNCKYRWLMTGTPVQNSEKDLFPVFGFLKLEPFDDPKIFRLWAGGQRLNCLMMAICLRRTKKSLHNKHVLKLPNKIVEYFEFKMDEKEEQVHQYLLAFSQAMFREYLSKTRDDFQFTGFQNLPMLNPEEFERMREQMLSEVDDDVQSCHVFVLLLRLRQLCCHPSLLKSWVSQKDLEGSEIENSSEEKLNSFTNALSENCLNAKNPIFDPYYVSSKIKIMLDIIKDRFVQTGNSDKIVIVSEWISYLRIIGHFLETIGITYDMYDGSLTIEERDEVLRSFNLKQGGPKVLLLSLIAGGVGLDLTVANHVFFLT